jgi:hypothetical protein
MSEENARKKRKLIQASSHQFYNSFVIIWLDLNVNELDEKYQNRIIKLRQISDSTQIFVDTTQCVDCITDLKHEKVFMIISCDVEQWVISFIHSIDQLDSIYIFCEHTEKHNEWTKDWPKMKGVYANIESVSNAIKHETRRWDLSLISISIVTSTNDFNKLDQSFMYSQLLTGIIRKLEDDHGEAKNRFVKFLRCQYVGNDAQLKIIDEFERDYEHKILKY